MSNEGSSRRAVLARGTAALAGLAMLRFTFTAEAVPAPPDEVILPWSDLPPPNPVPQVVGQQLDWEKLDSWLTPNDRFFTVAHYGQPTPAVQEWRLRVDGLVQRPLDLTMADLRARPRREVTATLECSGNHGLPWFIGGVGNATWAGTPLAPLLREVGVLDGGTEVVFWGADSGKEKVRDAEVTERFARSMTLAEAGGPDTLLAYEMNGQPLPLAHGAPLRLIAPGWYGVANVKWLRTVEVRDSRYEGRFMGRDYVTIRDERRDDETVSVFASVGRARIKSAPARVTHQSGTYRIMGAAWGGPIARVEVKIDGGPWTPATLGEGAGGDVAWTFWSLDWPNPGLGEHTVTSRAIDAQGRVQPAMEDPAIANKRTYWESNGQITRHINPRAPAARRAPVAGLAPGQAVAGHVDAGAGGHFAEHRFDYPGGRAVYRIDLQVVPDLPEVLARAGFRVYGPVAGREYLTGGAQPGLRPNVSGNLIGTDPGEYTVQVYNHHPTLAIDYELGVSAGRPEDQ